MKKNKTIEVPNENLNETVTDIKIEELIPNVIDNFIVTIFEDHHTVALPMNITGSQFRAWYAGKGGVFSKDVLKFSLNKSHGKYVLIKNSKLNCVARLITEDEELQFKTLKLVDGQIKDRPYMILKKLEEGEKLSSTQIYINEREIEIENESNFSSPAKSTTHEDDDFEGISRSISLFSE